MEKQYKRIAAEEFRDRGLHGERNPNLEAELCGKCMV